MLCRHYLISSFECDRWGRFCLPKINILLSSIRAKVSGLYYFQKGSSYKVQPQKKFQCAGLFFHFQLCYHFCNPNTTAVSIFLCVSLINGHQLALMQVLGWRVRIFGPFHRLHPAVAKIVVGFSVGPTWSVASFSSGANLVYIDTFLSI